MSDNYKIEWCWCELKEDTDNPECEDSSIDCVNITLNSSTKALEENITGANEERPGRRKRRKYRYNLGKRNDSPLYHFSPAKVRDILKKLGFKPKIMGVNITSLSRVAIDSGFLLYETKDSLAGHTYRSIFKIVLYAFPEDIELIEIIFRGCYCDILPNEDEIQGGQLELPDRMTRRETKLRNNPEERIN